MEEVEDAGFEDFSVSNTLERLASTVEQAVDRWLKSLSTGARLSGACAADPASPQRASAVEGVHTFVAGSNCTPLGIAPGDQQRDRQKGMQFLHMNANAQVCVLRMTGFASPTASRAPAACTRTSSCTEEKRPTMGLSWHL
jgi:hypothetical protein